MNETLDLTGRRVGRYKILSPLGAGGMGVVYDAIDTSLDRHVAVKVLRPEMIGDPARIQRFAREARSASALSHPHVVAVHEIGADDVLGRTVHFIAMEKIDGVTLRQTIVSGSLDLRQRLQLLVQVCDAVAAAHSAGVVHRDLKPENVMVSEHGYAKVLDFGLAKLRDEEVPAAGQEASTEVKSTSTGVVLGTAGYMSPEQAAGRKADHRTDIFALGCILYELVTGHRAFKGETAVDTLHRILHSEPEPIQSFAADAPESLQRIVGRATAKDPERRYQAMKDLALDLREVIEDMEWKNRSRKTRLVAAPAIARKTVIVAAALIIPAIVATWLFVRSRETLAPAPAPAIQTQRITNSGDVINVAISPDGKYVCFVVIMVDGQSLRLRQLATGRELVLVPKVEAGIFGATFTPDSTAVVFARKGGDDPEGTFYRIPVIGGPAEPIATGLHSRVTFSPDGERMAWTRSAFPEPDQSALMVANRDGTGVRTVAVRQEPERFAPIYFAAPSWSPDGSRIAAVVANEADRTTAVLGVDPATGDSIPLTKRTWAFASAVEWMPDMSGVVTVAADSSHAPPQLWLISWPSGDVRRITNDIFRYRTASVSADGRNLVAVAADQTTRVWVMPLDGSRPPERLTDGNLDGWRGVSYLPDGRLLFSSSDHLARIRTDGTGREETHNFFGSDMWTFTTFGGVIYFITWSGEIGTVNFDRTGSRILVRGADVAPFSVSPDGEWLAYTSETGSLLHKIPVAGGEPLRIGDYVGFSPAWSPSGDRIAFIQKTSESSSRLTVIDAGSYTIAWSHDLASVFRGRLRWMQDGSGLIVNDPSDSGDILVHAFDGTRRPLVETPATENVYAFDLSPDGSSIAFCLGFGRRDAHLITDFR